MKLKLKQPEFGNQKTEIKFTGLVDFHIQCLSNQFKFRQKNFKKKSLP